MQQIIISFIVGGVLVGLQSIISEKASSKVAGLIITLPTTILVSFYFLWQILSPAEFQTAMSLALQAMSATTVFIYAYIKFFQYLKNIFFASCLSFGIWFALAWFCLELKYDNFLVSVISAIVFFWIFQYLYLKEEICQKPGEHLSYGLSERLTRMIFAGSVIAGSVFIAQTLGAEWGGLASLFPAAAYATLLIFSRNYNHKFLFRIFQRSPIGAGSLLVFTIAAYFSFPAFGALLGSLASLAASLLYSMLIYFSTDEN